jgi:protein TonB
MSYLDQRMSPARLWAMVGVAILHVLIGFAFITGFYQKFTKEGVQDLDVFDVEEPPPPEELPPPDEPVPEVQSPEVYVPPPPNFVPPPPRPPMDTSREPPRNPPAMDPNAGREGLPQGPPPATSKSCPGYPGQGFPIAATCPAPPPQTKTCPGGQTVPVSANCPPVTPPAAPTQAKLQNPGAISNDDYPAAAQRAGAQGTTRITLQVGPNGRATGCSVTGSSGNSALDNTACSLAQRRFRFTPATRDGKPVAGSASTSIRWVLPED